MEQMTRRAPRGWPGRSLCVGDVPMVLPSRMRPAGGEGFRRKKPPARRSLSGHSAWLKTSAGRKIQQSLVSCAVRPSGGSAGGWRCRRACPERESCDTPGAAGGCAARRPAGQAPRPVRRSGRPVADVTICAVLGLRGRPRDADVTKCEVFTGGDGAAWGRSRQKPRIRIRGGARKTLPRGPGA